MVTEARYIKDKKEKYPEKENVGFMVGATGGFAGGEVGLKSFVENLADEIALSKKKGVLKSLNTTAEAKQRPLPLLMPGMTVKVVNEKNSYHDFTGIVQRVVDGKSSASRGGGGGFFLKKEDC